MASMMDKAKEFVAEKMANVPTPEAAVVDVSFKDVSREGATFAAAISVDNPYPTPLPICELSYTLKSAGRVIASGTMADPGSIAAKNVTKLELPFKVAYDFMLSLIRDVGCDWDIDYELELGLTIDLPIVGNFTIPLSSKGEIKLPTLSDFF